MDEFDQSNSEHEGGPADVVNALVQQVLFATGRTATTGATQENVHTLMVNLLGQLEQIVPQFMTNLHGPGAEAHPYWGLVARDRSGEQQVLVVPKDSGALETLQQKLFFATVFAFAHEPGVLAWLATHGVHVQFIEQRTLPTAGPKLIL